MKRNFYALWVLLIALTPITLQAQHYKCGSTQKQLELYEKHPELLQQQQTLDSLVRIPQGSSRVDTGEVYIIPIVFHIVHNYGPENISDEQIYDAVRILNEDYRMLNADTTFIVDAFKEIAGDARIEFRLAQVGPDLECTNGIDRIQSYKTYIGNDDAKLNPWPRNYYLNIWVVNRMQDGVAGYAYFPGSVASLPGSSIDGVIILSDYIGSIGTGAPGRSRALTHEIGHYLNLPHTWGNTNQPGVACGDDGILDTPPTSGHTRCDTANSDICTPGVEENVQNYMEYAYCSNMFTEGQIAIMRNTMLSTESNRSALWSDLNLDYTGVNSQAICGPVSDMYANKRFVCEGEPVQFFNASWREELRGVQWTFENGVPATSTDPSPSVVFVSPGWHKVTLLADGLTSDDTKVEEKYIYVGAAAADYTIDFSENFLDEQQFNDKWVSFHLADEDDSWHLVSGIGFNDGQCVMVDNYRNNRFDKDDLISPSVDLGTHNILNPRYLNFLYSSAVNTQSALERRDTLALYYSTDCGASWTKFDELTDQELYTRGFEWRDYAPEKQSDWSAYSYELPSNMYSPNTRFKFQLNSGPAGNNLYIDQVNVSSERISGVEDEVLAANSVNMFPNPATAQVTLSYQISSTANVSISVLNMLGKEVASVPATVKGAGTHETTLNIADLAGGVYFITFTAGNQQVTQKLVVTAK